MYHYIYVYIIAFLVISFVAYEFQPEFGSALIIVARMGEGRGVYRVLVGNRRERDHWGDLGRDNIRMDLQVVVCGYMDWIGLAQDRDRWRTLVSVVMNLRVP